MGNKNCPALLFQFLNFSKSLLFCSFINLIFAKEPAEAADKAYFRYSTNECVVGNIRDLLGMRKGLILNLEVNFPN